MQISKLNHSAYLIIKFISQLDQQPHILENASGLVLHAQIFHVQKLLQN